MHFHSKRDIHFKKSNTDFLNEALPEEEQNCLVSPDDPIQAIPPIPLSQSISPIQNQWNEDNPEEIGGSPWSPVPIVGSPLLKNDSKGSIPSQLANENEILKNYGMKATDLEFKLPVNVVEHSFNASSVIKEKKYTESIDPFLSIKNEENGKEAEEPPKVTQPKPVSGRQTRFPFFQGSDSSKYVVENSNKKYISRGRFWTDFKNYIFGQEKHEIPKKKKQEESKTKEGDLSNFTEPKQQEIIESKKFHQTKRIILSEKNDGRISCQLIHLKEMLKIEASPDKSLSGLKRKKNFKNASEKSHRAFRKMQVAHKMQEK